MQGKYKRQGVNTLKIGVNTHISIICRRPIRNDLFFYLCNLTKKKAIFEMKNELCKTD
uniref:Uncharacterized protein n=1 Tax=Siphoviridae sp. ctTwu10 TaxID=2825525 RepID=A0A8S5P7R8_9CAUD|nr:MAG TPA: hypothetical protein [Siphoviridae sp. ctTwu10]